VRRLIVLALVLIATAVGGCWDDDDPEPPVGDTGATTASGPTNTGTTAGDLQAAIDQLQADVNAVASEPELGSISNALAQLDIQVSESRIQAVAAQLCSEGSSAPLTEYIDEIDVSDVRASQAFGSVVALSCELPRETAAQMQAEVFGALAENSLETFSAQLVDRLNEQAVRTRLESDTCELFGSVLEPGLGEVAERLETTLRVRGIDIGELLQIGVNVASAACPLYIGRVYEVLGGG